MTERSAYQQELIDFFKARDLTLVAVSKIQPLSRIRALYDLGQRDFGENYVQELVEKAGQLPGDIRWHFIGHLQSNKVKQVLPFAYLIQGVDSIRLLREINKQALKSAKVQNCLLQVFIAEEETKFGFDEAELDQLLSSGDLGELQSIRIRGLMGMASFTDDPEKLTREFSKLRRIYEKHLELFQTAGEPVLSMGMSSDYKLAIGLGSTMVRIGSALFGARPAKP